MANPETRLSIVIPTFNRHERLRRAVDIISAQILAGGLAAAVEVIVVDDGSEPICAAATRTFIDGSRHRFLRFLPLAANGGASAARNAGAQISRGAVVAFLDDDIVPADGYVAAIMEAHRDHPDALVINGNLRALRPSVYADFWFYYYNAVFNRPGETFFTVEMLASGHCSMKRALLELERPLFDPALTAREDVDLFLRLKARGVPSYKDDRILAFVECRDTLAGFVKQRLWYGRGQQQLIAKHGPAVPQMPVPPNPRFLHLYLLLRLARRAERLRAAVRA